MNTFTQHMVEAAKKVARLTDRIGMPPRVQFAALPWRKRGQHIEILLITSRDTGRWIIPKGWPMRKTDAKGAAEIEAYEEAGIKGLIADEPIGTFRYRKDMSGGRQVICQAYVFPMEVKTELKDWPEKHQRRRHWYPVAKAVQLVNERDLKRLMKQFADEKSRPDANQGK